jgi:molybdopterin converting factor small subunit
MIKLVFFGATAEIVGNREIKLQFEGRTSVQVVVERLFDDFPGLRAHRLLFAVNQEYAGQDYILNDRDELAIFTAVSGG